MLGGALVLSLEGVGAGSIQGDSGGGELHLCLLDDDGLERPTRGTLRDPVRRRSGCGRRGAVLPSAARGPACPPTAAAACEHKREHKRESPNRKCALQC